MRTLFQSILVILAFGLTIGAALIYGQKSYRWGTNQQMVSLITAVDELPTEIGEWTQSYKQELDSSSKRLLNCFASFVGEYQHNVTSQRIQVGFLLGPAGPVSVHTPDVCFDSLNYRTVHKRARTKVGSGDFADSFWSIYFQSKDVDGGFLRSVYGWSVDGDWKSPDSSRLAFAGKPYLFKLQVSTTSDSQSDIENDRSIEQFLEQFTSVFRKQLRKSGGK